VVEEEELWAMGPEVSVHGWCWGDAEEHGGERGVRGAGWVVVN